MSAMIEPNTIYSMISQGIKDTYLTKMNLGPESIYCMDCRRAFETPEDHKDHPEHKTFNRQQFYFFIIAFAFLF